MTDLTAALTQLTGLGQAALWSAFLVSLRVGAVMALLPAFGEQVVPQRVRLVLTLAFTAVILPVVAERLPTDGFIVPFAAEVVAGLALGIGLRLFILALQIAGTIAAQAASLSQLFGGAGPEPQPAIANLLVLAGLALAVNTGLHLRAAEAMILSYDVFPAGRLPRAADLADWGLGQVTRAFGLGFTLAAPFVIASVIYNVALGVINRAMPQLMVAFVGAPALTLGGLVLLAVTAPVALSLWVHALQAHLAAPFAPLP
ncbi:flagellar biosynthetic protein FliR [Fertoebacter nigrum]|uniref:Flagellar biosynthetic protein FliR n=1 Tax=Fertoeibacter niger TaxID=2656921 RepID=A0A8X8H031_9RHOB|nr:flagellar biosynthetic protein FliR [Fertoeibacter niger]NUB44606.1 flagellar biosynthetic protein FliR [Fertoeibacter niger]